MLHVILSCFAGSDHGLQKERHARYRRATIFYACWRRRNVPNNRFPLSVLFSFLHIDTRLVQYTSHIMACKAQTAFLAFLFLAILPFIQSAHLLQSPRYSPSSRSTPSLIPICPHVVPRLAKPLLPPQSPSYTSSITSAINKALWWAIQYKAVPEITKNVDKVLLKAKTDLPKVVYEPISDILDDALNLNTPRHRAHLPSSPTRNNPQWSSSGSPMMQLKKVWAEFRLIVLDASPFLHGVTSTIQEPLLWIKDKLRQPIVAHLTTLLEKIMMEARERIIRALARGIEVGVAFGQGQLSLLPEDSKLKLENAGLVAPTTEDTSGSRYDAGLDAQCHPRSDLDDASIEFWIPADPTWPDHQPKMIRLKPDSWWSWLNYKPWAKYYTDTILSAIMLEVRGEVRSIIRSVHRQALESISHDGIQVVLKMVFGTPEPDHTTPLGDQNLNSKQRSVLRRFISSFASSVEEVTAKPMRKVIRKLEREAMFILYGEMVSAVYGYFELDAPYGVQLSNEAMTALWRDYGQQVPRWKYSPNMEKHKSSKFASSSSKATTVPSSSDSVVQPPTSSSTTSTVSQAPSDRQRQPIQRSFVKRPISQQQQQQFPVLQNSSRDTQKKQQSWLGSVWEGLRSFFTSPWKNGQDHALSRV